MHYGEIDRIDQEDPRIALRSERRVVSPPSSSVTLSFRLVSSHRPRLSFSSTIVSYEPSRDTIENMDESYFQNKQEKE